jgi:type III pantothenate kinase
VIATLDLGNSSVGVRLQSAGCIERVPHGESPGAQLLERIRSASRIVGVAVHGRAELVRRGWLGKLTAVDWVGHELPAPGRVAYDDPSELGLDRRVAAYGALRKFGPSLVVDCGTALTLTLAQGEEDPLLYGLAIAPGFATCAKGLADAAPALARWLNPTPALTAGIPTGSGQNLAMGIRVGWRALVRGLLEEAERRLAAAGLHGELLITGTDAPIAREAIGRGRIVEGLVHDGLLALAREQEHGETA